MSTRSRSIHWQPAARCSQASTQRGRRTRERIVSAAITVFGRQGFSQSSMLDIAEEAGVASGTAYQYFTDKADIFTHLLATLEERLHRETRMPAGRDGRLAVRDSVLKYLDVYRENAAVFRVWWEMLEPPTQFTDSWRAMHEKSRGELVRVIGDGKDREIVDHDLDEQIAAELILSVFERHAYARVILGQDSQMTDGEVARLIGQLLGHGLLREESSTEA
jgi:AcrR family transcriptional regulator